MNTIKVEHKEQANEAMALLESYLLTGREHLLMQAYNVLHKAIEERLS